MKTRILLIALIALSTWQCSKEGGNESAAAFVSGQGGSLARFCIAGNYLYTVDEQNLKVYDISSGQEPVLKSSVAIGFAIETIYPFKDKLFIGSTSVVYIYSIANPEQPVKLGTGISPNVLRRCDPVVANDTVAFASLRTNGPCGGQASILSVLDIKDVTNPVQKTAFQLSEPYGLGYSDTVLYVCDLGLKVLNIKDPYNPSFIKHISDSNTYIDVICYGNTLICWVRDGALLYDISDKANPLFLTKII